MYGRDLEEDLKSDISDLFLEACLALFIPQYEYLANCLHTALEVFIFSSIDWKPNDLFSQKEDINCIIDVLTTYNNWDIKAIKEKFAESKSSLGLKNRFSLNHFFRI